MQNSEVSVGLVYHNQSDINIDPYIKWALENFGEVEILHDRAYNKRVDVVILPDFEGYDVLRPAFYYPGYVPENIGTPSPSVRMFWEVPAFDKKHAVPPAEFYATYEQRDSKSITKTLVVAFGNSAFAYMDYILKAKLKIARGKVEVASGMPTDKYLEWHDCHYYKLEKALLFEQEVPLTAHLAEMIAANIPTTNFGGPEGSAVLA